MADAAPHPGQSSDPQRVEETVHHHSARSKRGREKPKMQLSLTSMIDVIFLLLIYFVVTSNFIEDEGVIVAALPGAGGVAQAPPDEIVQKIEIYLVAPDPESPDVAINIARQLDLGNDFSRLKAELDGLTGTYGTDSPVHIIPEGPVRWQHVVNAFNQAKRAGYTKIQFAKPR